MYELYKNSPPLAIHSFLDPRVEKAANMVVCILDPKSCVVGTSTPASIGKGARLTSSPCDCIAQLNTKSLYICFYNYITRNNWTMHVKLVLHEKYRNQRYVKDFQENTCTLYYTDRNKEGNI